MKERGRITRRIGSCLLLVAATAMSVAGQTGPKPQKKFLSAPLLIEAALPADGFDGLSAVFAAAGTPVNQGALGE